MQREKTRMALKGIHQRSFFRKGELRPLENRGKDVGRLMPLNMTRRKTYAGSPPNAPKTRAKKSSHPNSTFSSKSKPL